MFNSYNDAHLMNESYVFYTTSTNTFRNPAFAALEDEEQAGEEQSCYDFARKKQQQQQKPGAAPLPLPSDRPGDSRPTTKQKLIDFCDNLAFTVRGKMFIMETNFKRRIRGLRRFLNKRVLPRRWRVSGSHPPRIGHDQVLASGSLGDSIGHERNSLGARRFSTCEPISAKALGFQQERILTRLERIKRDSQRLFNMQHATIMEGDTETVGGDEAADCSSQDCAAGRSSRFQAPVWLARSKSSPAMGADSDNASHLPIQPKTAQVGRGRWAAIARGNQQIRQAAAAYSLSGPKKTCIVCYERTPNIVTLPCEHSDICSDCFIEIIYMAVKNSQYPLRCVLCRQKVERIRCSRRLMLSVIKRNRKGSSKTGDSWIKSRQAISCRLPF